MRAKEWEREAKDSSFLLRGKDLSEAEQWVAKSAEKKPKPTTLQSQYILASREAATRTLWIIIVAVAVAFLVAVGLAIYAFRETKVANANADEAGRQKVVAEQRQKTRKRRRRVKPQQASTRRRVLGRQGRKRALPSSKPQSPSSKR
jgi:hypothetical protein